MIALVLAPGTPSLILLGGIVVALGLAILAAHLASYRPPSTKRLVSAGLAACVLSIVLLLSTPSRVVAQTSSRAPSTDVRTVQPTEGATTESAYGDGEEEGGGDDDFVMQDPCKKYTSADWQWWAAGCMWP